MLQPPKYHTHSVKNDLLKNTEWNVWFYLQRWFYFQGCNGDGGKNRKKKGKQKKKIWLLSHPPFYDMEANCFPVSENAENKPDLP